MTANVAENSALWPCRHVKSDFPRKTHQSCYRSTWMYHSSMKSLTCHKNLESRFFFFLPQNNLLLFVYFERGFIKPFTASSSRWNWLQVSGIKANEPHALLWFCHGWLWQLRDFQSNTLWASQGQSAESNGHHMWKDCKINKFMQLCNLSKRGTRVHENERSQECQKERERASERERVSNSNLKHIAV